MNKPSLWSFQGRASRSKFWLVFLLTTIASLVLFFFTALAMPTLVLLGMFSPKIVSVFTIVVYILQVPLWVISIATSVRRFHDRDKSGWWYLVFVPSFIISWVPVSESLSLVIGIPLFLVTLWFLVELGFFKGTTGSNNFGNDPLLPNAPNSPTTTAPQFAGSASFATPVPTGTSAGMLIVYIVAGIVFIALLGRLGWAFYQVRSDENQKSIEINTVTTVEPGSVSPVVDASPNRESATIDPDAFVVTVGSSESTTGATIKTDTKTASVPVSVVTSTSPTANLTVGGVTNMTIKYTGWYDYEWSSTNANNFSGTESLTGCADSSVNSPEVSSLVGQGSSGSISIPITPKHTGCTITYKFTVKKVETGQKATAVVVVIVE